MTRTLILSIYALGLIFKDMTLGQCRDTPLGNEQQLCEISKSNITVMSFMYGQDKDHGYVCNMILALNI